MSEDDRDIEDKAAQDQPPEAGDHSGDQPARAGAAADDEEPVDPREDAIDLSDLENEGIDGVVARLRARRDDPDSDPELDLPPPRRPTRAPWISALVVVLSLPLLFMLYSDFRFWLRANEPEDLGQVADLIAEGRLGPELVDRYVVLEGTPDVQNALVGANETMRVGILRVTEAGGRLFAAIPRDVQETKLNNYDGRFRGRVVPMRKVPQYPWIVQFYDTQSITVPVDLERASLLAGLRAVASDGTIEAETIDGEAVRLEPDDLLRVVMASDDANVQLGAKSFDAAQAEQAMTALGYPYLALDAPADPTKKKTGRIVHRFVARIPAAERQAAVARLLADLPADKKGGNADPAFGATVLQRFSTYVAAVEDIGLRGDALVVPRPTSEALVPYEASGDRLVPAKGSGDTLELDPAGVDVIRYEQRVRVDPDSLLILVGQEPSAPMMLAWGASFLVVCGIVLANLVSLLLWWRRRAMAPTT